MVLNFPDIFKDSGDHLCILFLLLITILPFTCGERKTWLNIKKTQNFMAPLYNAVY